MPGASNAPNVSGARRAIVRRVRQQDEQADDDPAADEARIFAHDREDEVISGVGTAPPAKAGGSGLEPVAEDAAEPQRIEALDRLEGGPRAGAPKGSRNVDPFELIA